jgi:hypothetical protein
MQMGKFDFHALVIHKLLVNIPDLQEKKARVSESSF